MSIVLPVVVFALIIVDTASGYPSRMASGGPSTTTFEKGRSIPSSFDTSSTTMVDRPVGTQEVAQSGTLTVSDVNDNRQRYVGQQITLRGKVVVTPALSQVQCPPPGTPCDRIVSIAVSLVDEGSRTQVDSGLPIYHNSQPYPCTHSSERNFRCGNFVNGSITTVTGFFVKSRVPSQSVDNKVIKWRDFYYLEVK